MKNLNINWLVLLVIFSLAQPHVNAQWDVTGNNLINPGILGSNTNFEVLFRTDGVNRSKLMQSQSSTINGFPGIAQDGFFGLSSEQNFFTGLGPYSMLHINGNNDGAAPQQQGWRPWMRYGMTVTSNRDLMYVGHLDRGEVDETDAVITWSDNVFGPAGPDNLRFIFTSGNGTGTPGTSQSLEGLEGGRFTGQGRFGCGDFSPSGANEQPTHQLDVNGQVRVRDVLNESPNVLITGKEQPIDPVTGDYVLNYLAFPGSDGVVLAGNGTWIETTGEDCDWEIIENAGFNDVISGHGNECYPPGHAGVGVTVPQAKLDVYHGPNQVNHKPDGIKSNYEEGTVSLIYEELAAINGTLRRQVGYPLGRGVWGKAYFAKANFGGDFLAQAATQTTMNCGVRGQAFGSSFPVNETYGGQFSGMANQLGAQQFVYGAYGRASGGTVAYGIYGTASGAGTDWAGYFNGDVHATGTVTWASDETLKQNIQPLESAMDIIQQIEPKKYTFLTEQFSQLNLPEGQQQGVIAQELEEVLPNLVKMATNPAKYDSLGNEISAAVEFKSVNYVGLIPYLIGGIKEQQAEIQQQEESIAGLHEAMANQNAMIMQMMDQIEMMQQQINGCCNGDTAPKSFGSSDESTPSAHPFGQNELYQNVPNPFRGQTTIRYTLEQGGRAVLNIHDSNGREITQLENAEQVAGTYGYVWDATGLPAGTYHYSLVVDGELLVKRAIKLQD